MYSFLNKFFFVFHSAVIVFNLLGWIWRKTRLANLLILLLTAFSWFVLGIWYGYGYCPCTDWHWQVRERLGYVDLPSSYTKFLVDSFTGGNVNERLVNFSTLALLLLALSASVWTNMKDLRRKRRASSR